ncbi:carotenoid oxygenase family protein [Bordetella sp. BOR01]|uniref:carotenoid oxygenase family protein n=1 Tax=Bordetella sp. BOR01 TaxID=2854779 RepID=UPI001C46017C|nr:carotenoid oxygenase family protein [Bordetella sp. BOR01]MBV7483162.1 carotenoid oxygenase family protein [Bordetella sp. BOR01]
MTPWQSTNSALSGSLAPVFDERDDIALAVDGELPQGIQGVFMRNGPNPMFDPGPGYTYPFDGTGMIHAIYLNGGHASYRNRWVRTRELNEECAAGRRLYNVGFGPPPHANLANTNIVRHAGRILALYEGDLPYELDAGLNTLGVFDGQGKLPGVMSAHPKLDPATLELLSVAYDLETGTLHYLRATSTGELDRCVPIAAPWPAMVHDIAITPHHVVVFLCPLVFDFSRQGPPADWEPERGSRVALIPREARSAGQVRWIEGPAFFHWHTLNAFEENGRIEVSLPWYDAFSLGPGPRRLELHRIVIDTEANNVEDHLLDDRACEFGRINDAYLGSKARFGYVGLRDPRPGETPQPGAFEAIARYDLQTGEKRVHRLPPGVTVGEPVFVADPRGKAEDDGFLFAFTHEAHSDTGRFLILDARDIAAEPVASIRLPRRVPAGLHGNWMPL